MKDALYQGRLINASEGVDIRNNQKVGKPDFLCAKCKEAARVEQAGGHMPDRFEHLERKGHCSRESKRR